MSIRIPPIQCLLTFEALARLRSVTQTGEELNVTPSAVSHRVRQLEQILGTKLFGRADFSLTTEGSEYLAHVREGLGILQRFPSHSAAPGRRKLRLAVTPTFARSILLPKLKQFSDAYPEIDLTLQVTIPLLDVVAEDADLMVRFGTGRYADVEHVCLAKDEVSPMASPAFSREHGPFDAAQDLDGVPLLRSPLEPWRTWFAAHDLDWPEPSEGSQFNDIGLMCDAAAAGMGVGAALQTGRPLAGKRRAGAPLSPPRTQSACALPVLAQWHDGTLGMRSLRALAATGHGLKPFQPRRLEIHCNTAVTFPELTEQGEWDVSANSAPRELSGGSRVRVSDERDHPPDEG